eukprot:4463866-Amphidinium_carterae.1
MHWASKSPASAFVLAYASGCSSVTKLPGSFAGQTKSTMREVVKLTSRTMPAFGASGRPEPFCCPVLGHGSMTRFPSLGCSRAKTEVLSQND